jgi:hypothetical protein
MDIPVQNMQTVKIYIPVQTIPSVGIFHYKIKERGKEGSKEERIEE